MFQQGDEFCDAYDDGEDGEAASKMKIVSRNKKPLREPQWNRRCLKVVTDLLFGACKTNDYDKTAEFCIIN